ncbi:MAG: hypothetical protein JWR22_1664 [Herminiimonas sp.]|nr:hypothetical protein [Herminiimonas sp.]
MPSHNARAAIRVSVILAVAIAAGVAGCAAPLAPPSAGQANTAIHGAPSPLLARQLNRVTWGINTATLQQADAAGYANWQRNQLHPRPAILPPAVTSQLNAMTIAQQPMERVVADLEVRRKAGDDLPTEEQRADAKRQYQEELARLGREAMSRSLLMALYSPNQLQEQMTWFWANYFNVHMNKRFLRAMVGDYEEHAIRPHALGHFRDLLRATAHHPAMLVYLDNAQNAANRINENYARELMELHTLGINGGYTQRDVQELARILTGLGINVSRDAPRPGRNRQDDYVRAGIMEFNPNRHDYGDKDFLGHRIQGRGMGEIDEALDLLARSPATARFVSGKIAAYMLADQPGAAVIDRMTRTFLDTDGDIAAVLQTLFDSPEYKASLGHKFRDPMHYVVASVRLAYNDTVILNTAPMINWLRRMGELPFGHQTPDGYALDESAWASPGQMATRFDIAKAIGSGSAGLFRSDEPTPHERPAFPQLANPAFYQGMQHTLGPQTRRALEQAGSPQEWNTLLLASPEMMTR